MTLSGRPGRSTSADGIRKRAPGRRRWIRGIARRGDAAAEPGFSARFVNGARGERHGRDPENSSILVADVVGYSRLAGSGRGPNAVAAPGPAKRLIDPAIAAHHGRIVKRTGDGSPDRISQRGRRGALRDRGAGRRSERNAGLSPEQAHRIRSGLTRATWSRSPTAISWATASTSPRGSRGSRRRARSVCRRTPIARSRGGLIWRSAILARLSSRTSPTRSGSIRCKSASRRRRSPRYPPFRKGVAHA